MIEPDESMRPTQDELTAKIHSEFTIDEETEKELRVWSVIRQSTYRGSTLEESLEMYDVTMEDYEKYKDTYDKPIPLD